MKLRNQLIKFLAVLPAISLSQFHATDQFKEKVNWDAFAKVPKVFVLAADKETPVDGKKWGIRLSEKYNGGFVPQKNHLQILDSKEKIKIIAVAAFPAKIPGLIQNWIRGQFQKEASNFGMILDFGSNLSTPLGYPYDKNPKIPGITIVPADRPDGQPVQPSSFIGNSDDLVIQQAVDQVIDQLLK